MDLLRVMHASLLVCVAVAASACYQHSRQSLEDSKAVEKIQAVDAQPPEERLDAYFGDRFSEVQKALAPSRRSRTPPASEGMVRSAVAACFLLTCRLAK